MSPERSFVFAVSKFNLSQSLFVKGSKGPGKNEVVNRSDRPPGRPLDLLFVLQGLSISGFVQHSFMVSTHSFTKKVYKPCFPGLDRRSDRFVLFQDCSSDS